MKKAIQRIIQTLFLALFVVLAAKGKIQVWMAIFVLSAVVSVFFSRLYCGWVCPINTTLKPITWIKKKLHIPSFKTPEAFKTGYFRILMLLAFLSLIIITFKTGKKLPVLPALVALGFVATLFFEEELWHHWLCPYGTLLSLPARLSRKRMFIDQERCTNCTKCAKVCPAGAIVREEKHMIIKNECLVCMECERVCSKQAISYQ